MSKRFWTQAKDCFLFIWSCRRAWPFTNYVPVDRQSLPNLKSGIICSKPRFFTTLLFWFLQIGTPFCKAPSRSSLFMASSNLYQVFLSVGVGVHYLLDPSVTSRLSKPFHKFYLAFTKKDSHVRRLLNISTSNFWAQIDQILHKRKTQTGCKIDNGSYQSVGVQNYKFTTISRLSCVPNYLYWVAYLNPNARIDFSTCQVLACSE